MKHIEAEKNELVLQNESGDYAIIPANKRAEVQQLLKDGCYECIDKIVSELPDMSDYANEGTVVASKEEVVPKLLDVIGELEGRGKYDILYGGKTNPEITNMTIRDLISYQKGLIEEGAEGSAAGKYQFIPDTLEDLINRGKLKEDEVFNQETQDRLAKQLLKEKGLNKFLRGDINEQEFTDNISKAWASIPYNTGRSYYDKDGKNKSLIDRDVFMYDVFGYTPVKKERVNQTMDITKSKFSDLDYSEPVKLANQISNLDLTNDKIKAEDGMVISNDPPSEDLVPKLLNTIGQLESSDNYDVTVGMKKNPNLVNMTINEVIDYSRSLGNSGAAGRYQIIPGTLEGLRDKGYVKGDDIFNAETQDKLAIELIKGRGLNKYLKGAITADEFADNLSKEWAALPYNTGRSYWAGVGDNKSLIDRSKFMADMFGVTEQPKEQTKEQTKEQPIQKPKQPVIEIDEMLSNETLMAELEAKFGDLDAIANVDFTQPVEAAQQVSEVSEADINRIKSNLISNGSATKESLKYLPLQALVRTLRSRNVDKYQGIANNPILLRMVYNSLKQM